MTPMIDCIFQLLIFFLLSSTFVTPAATLILPQTTAERGNIAEEIVITLDAQNQMYFNKEKIDPPQLKQKLATAFAKSGKRAVVLRADKNLVYEKVLVALLALQDAGATQLHLAYERQP